MTRYTYQRLSSEETIRIIGLQPFEARSDIRITLRAYPVSAAPEFEAISYVWGTGVRDHTIQCDGADLAVTSNVFAALQELKLAATVRFVWIDAICINQDDVQERSYQVTLMRNIYSTAAGVIVWLGPSQPPTRQAWETMRSIAEYEKGLLNEQAKKPWVRKPLLDQNVRVEIARLLSSSWFTRSWVVQEATCARKLTLRCGSHEADWETIRMTCYFLREQRGRHPLGSLLPSEVTDPAATEIDFYNANTMVLLLEAFQPSQGWLGGLEELLPSTRHLSATDPRDKVYAFLGLSHKRDERDAMTNITPDYTIDVDLLYCYTAKLIMHESVTLSMLCHVQRGPNSSFLPSWVPDWREPATIRILGETKPGRRPIYNSPKWSSSNQILDLQMDLRTLKVYGISFDEIEEVRTDIWLADKCRPDQTFSLGPNIHAFLKDVHDFMTTPLPARSHDMPTGDVQARLAVMQEMVDWATNPTGLQWTSQWLIQRYLDVQTAGLSVDTKDLRPGAPAWHYFMEKPPPDIIRREDTHPAQRPSSNYHPIQPQMQSATPSYNAVQPPAPPHHTPSATPSDPMQSPMMINLSDFTTQTTTPPNRGHFGATITAEHMALADKIKFGRAMFRTSKLGKVGLCPEWAQPGDVICYLRGATMPMALRPRGEAFTLVGECYVHEKMSESFQSSEEIRSFILV